MTRALPYEYKGVDGTVMSPYLEVEMGPGGTTSGAHEADGFIP